ncbi:MAG: hypothetical protein E6G68_00420 [Actinobacteria bacterium]|nr:MAG: hypothetical protein E6G68_00420 [Actinomycetota bacterium]
MTSTVGTGCCQRRSPRSRRRHEYDTKATGRPVHGRPCHRRASQRGLFERTYQPAPAATAAAIAAREQAVKFAECMRSNGVRAFPPDASGTFTIETIANGTLFVNVLWNSFAANDVASSWAEVFDGILIVGKVI